jgi:hypothetical protein
MLFSTGSREVTMYMPQRMLAFLWIGDKLFEAGFVCLVCRLFNDTSWYKRGRIWFKWVRGGGEVVEEIFWYLPITTEENLESFIQDRQCSSRKSNWEPASEIQARYCRTSLFEFSTFLKYVNGRATHSYCSGSEDVSTVQFCINIVTLRSGTCKKKKIMNFWGKVSCNDLSFTAQRCM